MPLNLAKGPQRSNLTPEQKREQLAAIYGVTPNKTADSMPSNLSHDEIERMRALIAQHDQNNRPGIKEFDLNNPPKEPYFHQPLPRLMYHHGKRTHKVAHTEEDVAAALESGWKKEPYPGEEDATTLVELDPESAAEAAAADAIARKPKAKK